nr:translation initiation factor IF-2-like [Equus asinus]
MAGGKQSPEPGRGVQAPRAPGAPPGLAPGERAPSLAPCAGDQQQAQPCAPTSPQPSPANRKCWSWGGPPRVGAATRVTPWPRSGGGGGADMESRTPCPPALLPQAAGRGGGCQPSPPPLGELGGHARGRGTGHLSHFRRLPGGRGGARLPRPLRQLLAAVPKHSVGARPWLDSSPCCRPPHSPPRPAGQRLRSPQRPGPGGARPRRRAAPPGAQARGWGTGPVPGRGRAGARGGGPDPQRTPSPARAPRSHVVVASREGGGPGQRRRGHALRGRGRRRGLLCAPSPGPGGRARRARGQAGPPRPGLSQARAGAGSGPLPRPGRSARPPPARGPRRAARAGAPTSFPGAAARGPGPGGGGGGGLRLGWILPPRAGRRQ